MKRKYYIGIDVAKAKIDVCYLDNPEHKKVKHRSFPNTPEGHKQLWEWLKKITGSENNEDFHIILEPTNVYHQNLSYFFHNLGVAVSWVNPQQTRHYAKSFNMFNKNDQKDAFILAFFGYERKPNCWQPPAKEIRLISALLRRADALEQEIQREQNRLEQAKCAQEDKYIIHSLEMVIAFLEKEQKKIWHKINKQVKKYLNWKKTVHYYNLFPVSAIIFPFECLFFYMKMSL